MELTLRHLAQLLSSPQAVVDDYLCNRVVLDSRGAGHGDLFLPLRGRNYDGHQFVAAALAQGAAALVERSFYANTGKTLKQSRLIPVEQVGAALHRLAEHLRERADTRFIAITGSTGKTTLKELLYHLLRDSHDIGCSPGNLNSTQGVPLAICNHLAGQRWFITELGASHPGEIARLSHLVKPELAVITNIGHAHAGLLGGLRGVQRTKSEIWQGLGPQGSAIIPLSDERVVESARLLRRIVTCSLDPTRMADYNGAILNPIEQGRYRLRIEGCECDCPLPGRHGAELALIAWTMARSCGMTPEAVAARLEAGGPVSGRFVIHETPHGRLVDDSYNASPESMRAALQTFCELPTRGRRIAVLAAMGELGQWSGQLHREVAEYASRLPVNRFLVLGNDARELFQGLRGHKKFFLQPEALLRELRRLTMPEDLLLFKGSNIYGLGKLVRELMH